MNRRIWENDTFGRINKGKALSDEEIDEIDRFKIATDPLYVSERMKEFEEITKQFDEQNNGGAVKKPSDYFGKGSDLGVGAGGSFNLGFKLANLLNSAWAKSFASDFIEETNGSQMKVSIGQI